MASKIENTEYLGYSNADSNDVNLSEKTTQLARKPSADGLTQGQPQVPTSSLSDVHAAHGAPSFQRATPKGLDYPASLRISHERNHSSNDLPSHPSGVNDKPRDIVGHHGKLVAPDVSPEKEIARSEDERLVELERKLAAVLATQTERDRPIAQLTDELAQNSVNATEEKKRAGLEQRQIQAKLDELLLSHDHAIEANENLRRCVSSSRRGSPNWQQSIYDSRTLRVVGPRAKRQVSPIRMKSQMKSRVGLWHAWEL